MGYKQLTTQHMIITHMITVLATVYIYLPGILHHLCSCIQNIFGLTFVMCSLELEGGAAVHLVITFWHETLSSKSGILWIYGAFKTTGKISGFVRIPASDLFSDQEIEVADQSAQRLIFRCHRTWKRARSVLLRFSARVQ